MYDIRYAHKHQSLFQECRQTYLISYIALACKFNQNKPKIIQLNKKFGDLVPKIMKGFRQNDRSFATKACHAGQDPEQWASMAVVPPITMSTTFKQFGPADFKA